MRSGKNILIGFLALTTIATGTLAWRQYRELLDLRAAALGNDERAALQKRIWAAEKHRAELEKHVATHPAAPADEEPAAGPEGPPPDAAGPRSFRRPDFSAVMDRPEMQKLFALQRRAGLDAHYAGLFKALHLAPDQLEKFKSLLVDRSTAVGDVMVAAREQGINPRTDRAAFSKLVADAQANVDSDIHSLLGDSSYSEFQHYEQTQPQRNVVGQLEQRLSYSSTPLTPEQSAQLVDLLAATGTGTQNPSGVTRRGAAVAGFLGVNVGQTQISDAAINQSLGLLAAPQVDALRQLQAEQQAQAELSAEMRRQFQSARQNIAPSPPGTAAAKTGD